jgi:hypothetical protein
LKDKLKGLENPISVGLKKGCMYWGFNCQKVEDRKEMFNELLHLLKINESGIAQISRSKWL